MVTNLFTECQLEFVKKVLVGTKTFIFGRENSISVNRLAKVPISFFENLSFNINNHNSLRIIDLKKRLTIETYDNIDFIAIKIERILRCR